MKIVLGTPNRALLMMLELTMIDYTLGTLYKNSTALGPLFDFAMECIVVCGDNSKFKVILDTRIRTFLLIWEFNMFGYSSEALYKNSTTQRPLFEFAIECRIACGDKGK